MGQNIMYGDIISTTIDGKEFLINSDKEVKMRKIYPKEMLRKMGIKDVIHNDDATIIILNDGRKGVAVRDKNEPEYTPFGFAMAYAYAMGTDGNKSQFKKNLKKIIK